MEKSNKINNLRKRNNMHHTEELREYVIDLWMSGRSAHVIDRLVERKIRQMRWERKQQKSA